LRRGWIEAGTAQSLPVHPVQLYASLAGLVMFVCLSRWRPRYPGDRFAPFAVMYGASRFGLEWLRGDFNPVLGPFSLPQAYSVVFAVIGLVVLLSRPGRRGTPVVPEIGVICPPGGLGRYVG